MSLLMSVSVWSGLVWSGWSGAPARISGQTKLAFAGWDGAKAKAKAKER